MLNIYINNIINYINNNINIYIKYLYSFFLKIKKINFYLNLHKDISHINCSYEKKIPKICLIIYFSLFLPLFIADFMIL